ncbi:unnamed protein product [Trichogramma brassicae]|uniref:Uncharacterized protein n=1 Tax=Trichogramma brassicae TaxID=86971 RepID=A0A6H5J0K4_9HYME|nr:unnamed protein product [Trichogramma brassicae]
MAEFISIYKRDYAWPKRRSFFPRTDLACRIALPESYCLEFGKPPKPIVDAPRTNCPKDQTTTKDRPKIPTAQPRCSQPSGEKTAAKCSQPLPDETKCKSAVAQLDNEDLAKLLHGRVKIGKCPDTLVTPELNETESCLQKKLLAQLPEVKATCPMDADKPEVDCRRPDLEKRATILRHSRSQKKSDDPCESKYFLGKLGASKAKRIKPSFEDENEITSTSSLSRRKLPPWSTEYREIICKTGVELQRQLKMGARRRALMRQNRKLLKKDCGKDDPNMIESAERPTKVGSRAIGRTQQQQQQQNCLSTREPRHRQEKTTNYELDDEAKNINFNGTDPGLNIDADDLDISAHDDNAAAVYDVDIPTVRFFFPPISLLSPNVERSISSYRISTIRISRTTRATRRNAKPKLTRIIGSTTRGQQHQLRITITRASLTKPKRRERPV